MDKFEKKLELCLAKLNKEIDLDWSEIADELGLDCSSDHLRKTAYGIKECYDYFSGKTKEMIAEEEYQKLLDKEIQLKKEKVKIQDMKNQLNKQIREQARHESLGDILREKIDTTNTTLENYKPRTSFNKEMVLLISDIHFGIKTFNAMRPYDSDVCQLKMNYLIDKTIDYVKQNNVEKLNVLILGDELSGLIHSTTRLEQREDIIQQVLGVSDLLYKSIEKLSKNIVEVSVGMVAGNHTRVIADKKQSLEQENFTKLVKEFIKLKTVNLSNVTIIENEFDEDIIELNLFGYNIVAVHGHNDSQNHLNRLIEMFDRRIDYIFLGHYHQSKEFEINNTEVIINGCFSGDDYSKRLRLYNKPIQKVLLFTKEGKVATYNINLDFYDK